MELVSFEKQTQAQGIAPSNRRVLIVDDNAAIHNDFRKVLSSQDPDVGEVSETEKELFGKAFDDTASLRPAYEIDFASQGQDALKMVERAQAEGRPYAVVFMDVRMPPGWDGIETTRRIWDRFPFTEVVVCTAYTDYSTEQILEQLGCTDRLLFLKKPFDAAVVQQLACALTTKWSLGRELRARMESLEEAVGRKTAELKASLDELGRANQELQASIKKEREAQTMLNFMAKMSALGEMAGGIAHEINNPLAIIQLSANLLADAARTGRPEAAAVMEASQLIESTCHRIAKIVKGLRVFARGGESEPLQESGFDTIVEDTLSLCRERFKTNGIELEIKIGNPAPTMECRPIQISQVLINLLNNACDAVEPLERKVITIEGRDLGDFVELSVADSGPGISQELREKIMQPFFTTKEVGKGTGLGLSISRGLIKSHGGDLYLDEAASCTRFVLRLPRKQRN